MAKSFIKENFRHKIFKLVIVWHWRCSSCFDGFDKAQKLNLEICLQGTDIVNDWDFGCIRRNSEADIQDIYITNEIDDQAKQTLNEVEKYCCYWQVRWNRGKMWYNI